MEIEDIALDPTAFPPPAATLKSRPLGIGRLKVTAFDGDTDGDGDYDELLLVRRALVLDLVDRRAAWCSTAATRSSRSPPRAFPANFNASNTNNTRDDRSDDKGPEPEGVTVANAVRPHLRVRDARAHRRRRGVTTSTNPAAPAFVQYINTRNFSAATNTAAAGDLGPEAARVVPAELSPTGQAAAARVQRGERFTEGLHDQRRALISLEAAPLHLGGAASP